MLIASLIVHHQDGKPSIRVATSGKETLRMPLLVRCLFLSLSYSPLGGDSPSMTHERDRAGKVDFDTWRPAEENEEEGK